MKGLGPREQFLLTKLPPLQGVVVGGCSHTCVIRANMGKKNFERIGMRSHYVSPSSSSIPPSEHTPEVRHLQDLRKARPDTL